MKLSLRWIFDHIDARYQDHDAQHIVVEFNKKVAEIDGVCKLSWDLSSFFLGRIKAIADAVVTLTVPELKADIQVPFTKAVLDMHNQKSAHEAFLIRKTDKGYRFAIMLDFDVDKEGIVPPVYATEDQMASWRSEFEADDVILDVDNKSITHRPDMWSHRGFAREIAAYLGLALKPEETLIKNLPVLHEASAIKGSQTNKISVHNTVPQTCFRFTGLYFDAIAQRPGDLLVTSRLLKIGNRPISGLVDMTNYLMNDWGQPVHAYDADTIKDSALTIRMAAPDERMDLLYDESITLSQQDMVIADASRPLCLAGVRGGADSGVSASTQRIFFEAATFDAGSVRRSAQRHKTRTDSSTRFEKTLDRNLPPVAIMRFIKLLKEKGFEFSHADEIISVGSQAQHLVLEVTHDFLVSRMGVPLSSEQIVSLLQRLEFKVLMSQSADGGIVFLITVPTFRSSKDIKIKEDILEEVVRSYGFERIPLQMPQLARMPHPLHELDREHQLKRVCAFGAGMIEQQNYSLYDESFLRVLDYAPQTAVQLQNPISENLYRMITSLIPGLVKNVHDNHVMHDELAFFELGRVWQPSGEDAVERKMLAGIFFKKRASVDFYKHKAIVNDVLHAQGFRQEAVAWTQAQQHEPWYMPYQTASLHYADMLIGYAGKANGAFLDKLGVNVPCEAFIFEIDADFLLGKNPPHHRFAHISKFQDTYLDISAFVPRSTTVERVSGMLQAVSPSIYRVELVDFFEKDEWPDKRSLTMRMWLSDRTKTLDKDELEAVLKRAISCLTEAGMQVRA